MRNLVLRESLEQKAFRRCKVTCHTPRCPAAKLVCAIRIVEAVTVSWWLGVHFEPAGLH
jgi:hypothetical protein